MEKLALFETMGKEAIQNAIDQGEWIDGTILTRHMLRQLRDYLSQMPEPTPSERYIYN